MFKQFCVLLGIARRSYDITFHDCLDTSAKDEISKDVLQIICSEFKNIIIGELKVYTSYSGDEEYPATIISCQKN